VAQGGEVKVDTNRPTVRCLMAYPLGVDTFNGRLRTTDIKIVSLETAAYFKDLGWWILGPDPEDMDELARWEREHR
jgi:hypothetical protein